MEQEKITIDTSLLKKKLVDCNLSVRALCCCKSAGIETVADLAAYKKMDMLKFRKFGKKSITELDDFLSGLGLKWGTNYMVNEKGEVVKVEQK